jgi:hypothetical protein
MKGDGNAKARRSGKEGNGWVYPKGELKPSMALLSKIPGYSTAKN